MYFVGNSFYYFIVLILANGGSLQFQTIYGWMCTASLESLVRVALLQSNGQHPL